MGFLDKISIKNRLILLTVLVSMVLFLSITAVNSIQSYNNLLEEKENQLIEATDMAISTLQMYEKEVKEGRLSEEEAQKLAKKAIANMNYNEKKGYLWVQDYNSYMVMHPFSSELDGKDLSEKQDPNGTRFFKALTDEVNKNEKGFVKYLWTKPNEPENKLFEKLSFGQGYKKWGWIVASGVYIDDIQTKLIDTITQSVIYSLIAVVLVIIAANLTIVRSIIRPLGKLTEQCLQLANNDLSVDITDDKNKTEIGDLNRSVKILSNNMRNLVIKIKEKSDAVATSSQELQSISENSSQVATQVAETIEQMAMGYQSQSEEVTNSSLSVAEIARIASESAKNVLNGQTDVNMALQKILQIKNITEDLAVQIDTLGSLGIEIGKIVELITNIARQTNLLALNAAIESARAGEHGKGFAVVAEEVKQLAEESAEAAEQIKGMIEQIQDNSTKAVESTKLGVRSVEEGVFAVNQVKQIFETIHQYSTESEEKTQSVSVAMETISSVTEEAAASAEEVSASMEEQNAGMQELSASAQMLAALTNELNDQVNTFKL